MIPLWLLYIAMYLTDVIWIFMSSLIFHNEPTITTRGARLEWVKGDTEITNNNPRRMHHRPYISSDILPLWLLYKHGGVTSP